MSDFEVTGADQFLRLSKALKEAGRTELRKDLHKALKNATKPLLPRATAKLAAALPARLAARGVKTKQAVQVRTGSNPGVRITVRYGSRGRGLGASNARLLNRQGVVRHPVFGDRETWRNTRAPSAKGWFDDTYSESAPTVRPLLEQALEDIADRVVKEAGQGG